MLDDCSLKTKHRRTCFNTALLESDYFNYETVKIIVMALGNTEEHPIFQLEQPAHYLTHSYATMLSKAHRIKLRIPKVSIYGNLGVEWRINPKWNNVQCSQPDAGQSVLVIG